MLKIYLINFEPIQKWDIYNPSKLYCILNSLFTISNSKKNAIV